MTDRLESGEAHVWYIWPDRITDRRLEEHDAVLNAQERARCASFRFARDRRTQRLTRAFVRTILSRYADVKPEEWQFSQNSHGKPEIGGPAGAPVLTFNLSHTEGFIVCALARTMAVGIDAEHLRELPDCLDIARRHFSPEEYGVLEKLSDAERHRRFYEYWTLKEAYVKARGLGVSLDLSKFTFRISNPDIAIAFAPTEAEDPASWQFQLWRPDERHIAAAAVRCGQQSVRFEVRDGTSVME
jgi:4'-phosphopantetheinyl transferase